jgi:3-hydroxyisobutyrate dehydrogenase
MKKIGFVGLGNMGFKMASNLLENGHKVFGYDIDEKLTDDLGEKGLIKVKTLEDFSNNMDIIITMLPDGNIVEDVLKAILQVIKNNPILIDCSTIDVNKSKSLYNLCLAKSINFLDAPVSGGTKGAEQSTLTFMVGGNIEIYKQIIPVLKAMGSKIVYCGESGSGQATKLCNNMLLAITMIGVSESLSLAKNLNLNLNTLFDVLSTATGSCWAINNYYPVKDIGPASPADNDFEPGFSASLMSKDLKLALNAARDSKTSTKLGEMAEKLYSKMANGENKNKDFSAIIKEAK